MIPIFQKIMSYKFSILIDASIADVENYFKNPESLKRMDAPGANIRWSYAFNDSIFHYKAHLGCFYTIYLHREITQDSSLQTKLLDEVRLIPRFGIFSRIFKKGAIEKLFKLFKIQHKNFMEDLSRYDSFKGALSKQIVISGASGFVGSFLKVMFKLFGYSVKTLVRKRPKDEDEIFWDPYCELIDKRSLEGVYAVINLTGENLFSFRWSRTKKQKILQSRVRSTKFLAHTLNQLQYPPKVFFCASAVGYYGHLENSSAAESAQAGEGFLAHVAASWEEMSKIFTKGKSVQMRLGVVISSQGGLLKKVLPLFSFGLGAILGSGKERLSWISLEDVAYQLLFLLKHAYCEGPYNFCSSNTLTQQEFALKLSQAVKKPLWMRFPRWLLYAILGEMSSLMLNSIEAKPKKLLELGAKFAYPNFSETLQHNIGL